MIDGLNAARDQVLAALSALDPRGDRTGHVLRQTYDQLYDGGRTGRYRWDQLFKTEKTHFGTLVEINLQREFRFQDGQKLDYRIAGHEVDAKYSQAVWGWMLPPEAVGELCLVITASDERSTFSLGVVRASTEHLNIGANRDAKKTLSVTGRAAVAWLHRDAALPPNVLLQMDPADVDAVFSKQPGQQMVNELFRRAVGRRVSRAAVETVAQQKDPMKRVRGNGGAREHLAAEGIVILGGDYVWQREAARSLGLPEPGDSEFVSAYLAPDTGGQAGASTELGGQRWRVAHTRADAAPVPLSVYRRG